MYKEHCRIVTNCNLGADWKHFGIISIGTMINYSNIATTFRKTVSLLIHLLKSQHFMTISYEHFSLRIFSNFYQYTNIHKQSPPSNEHSVVLYSAPSHHPLPTLFGTSTVQLGYFSMNSFERTINES